MRLELAERLVCPAPHAATPLIVVADETVDRDLIRGTAGCMTCHREARVAGGSVDFGGSVEMASSTAPVLEPSEALLSRLTALLALGDAGIPLLLGDTYQRVAPALAERFDAAVAVLDALGPSPHGVGYVRGAGSRVPFADGCFHAAALDSHLSEDALADAVRCVRVGGRVLGDVHMPPPPRVRELARDAEHWVGEVIAPPTVVPLRRA
jgi:SAM-dependent methyltransferase